MSCTLDTTSTDGAGFQWGLDDSSLPNKKLDTSNGTGGDPQTISINPANGWHTLYARTIDSGGNLSTATTAYSFGVGTDGAAILSPSDGDTTARRLTLSAKGLTSYTGVTWQYRRGETDSWHTVPVGDMTAAGATVSAWPVAVNSGTATKLVWNTVSSLDGIDIGPCRRKRGHQAVLPTDSDPVLVPGMPPVHEHERPSVPGMERMRHTHNSRLTALIGCSRRLGPRGMSRGCSAPSATGSPRTWPATPAPTSPSAARMSRTRRAGRFLRCRTCWTNGWSRTGSTARTHRCAILRPPSSRCRRTRCGPRWSA